MQSRRDQVQAHLFVVSRLTSSMVRADPNAPDTPLGRTSRGGIIGLILMLAIALVAVLYGLIVSGGASAWQKPGTLVVVKNAGGRFLYVGGQLHPVLNETSAKLLAGNQFNVNDVDANSLAGVPRGEPIGIFGAPDFLPAPADLARGSWLACGAQQATQSGTSVPQLTLAIGLAGVGRLLSQREGILVSGADNAVYLLWNGQRLRVNGAAGALQALGYDTATPFAVTAAFLDALPAGPDLAAPDVPGRGAAGPVLAGRPTRIGQLFSGVNNQHYLLLREGLVPLTQTLYDLLNGDPVTQQVAYGGGPVTPSPIGPEDLAAHQAPATLTAQLTHDGALPATPPVSVLVTAGQGVCGQVQPGTSPTTSVALVPAAAVVGQVPARQPGVVASCRGADRIAVRPGAGALVRALSTGGASHSTSYVVTDGGVKYPVPSDTAVTQLGYDPANEVQLPDTLLSLLPTGPSLDPAAASSGAVVMPATSPGCGA
jgi:type VII secretion protein EccB